LKKSKLPKVTHNNEQEVLDACWTKGVFGNKLRNKIMKRMERVRELKRSQHPMTARGLSRATRTAKGMGKRNMSSIVLLVQENNKPAKQKFSKVSAQVLLESGTPQVNNSFAERTSARESNLNSSKMSRGADVYHTARDIRAKRELSKGSRRDNSVYETLRDQLQKITLKLDMEGIKSNDRGEWKQRRTRKERNDRNANLTNESSLTGQSQGSIPAQNYKKVSKIPQIFHTHRETEKKVYKKSTLIPRAPVKNTTRAINSQRNRVPVKKESKSVLNNKNSIKKQKENVGDNKLLKTVKA